MKHKFSILILLSAICFVGCGEKIVDYYDFGAETSAPYSIGDYYNEDGNRGIVFKVTDNGYSGKIVSLVEAKARWEYNYSWSSYSTPDCHDYDNGMNNWLAIKSSEDTSEFPAFTACASFGDGWYLPAVHELLQIGEYLSEINTTLSSRDFPIIRKEVYWSSTVYGGYENVFAVHFGDHRGYSRNSILDLPIRAVYAF